MKKIFKIAKIDNLFNEDNIIELDYAFDKISNNNYQDFLDYIIFLEKKKLIEIIRS